MTGRSPAVGSPSVPSALADHQRRIQILEAVPPAAGRYLQWREALYSGRQFQVLTANNNYQGGNDSGSIGVGSWYGGQWEWIDDATCPFDGVALSTATDGDWFPFALGNLGPQYSGYGVAFWYYGDATGATVDIEFATTPVDEAGNTPGGPYGSSTSVIGPSDIEYWGASDPGWFNNGNLTPDHGYEFDLSGGAAGWAIGNVIMNASTFMLASADGTPLTADANSYAANWDESSEFFAGGGPDLCWWMRLRVSAGGNGGFLARIGQVWVYRLNGAMDFVG